MSAHPPHSETPDDEASDRTWALLDHARIVTPSPEFSRRVLSAVPSPRTSQASRWHWLHQLWEPTFRPALAAAVALLVVGAWFLPSLNRPSPTAATTPATSPAPPTDESEEIVQAVAAELALLETVDYLLDPQDGLDLEEADIDRLLF